MMKKKIKQEKQKKEIYERKFKCAYFRYKAI